VSRKSKLSQFIERLLNNNEPEYFFLYREPHFGIDEDLCAFLKLSIPLKSDIHYDTLLKAKVLQLKDSFQHKLGYLVGTMYSKVGTEDWVPNQCDAEMFKEYIEAPLKNEDLILWLDPDIHKRVLKELKPFPLEEVTDEKFKEIIQEIKLTRDSKKKKLLELLDTVLTDLTISSDTIEKAKRRLENKPEFNQIMK
jgi:hypothetical protein